MRMAPGDASFEHRSSTRLFRPQRRLFTPPVLSFWTQVLSAEPWLTSNEWRLKPADSSDVCSEEKTFDRCPYGKPPLCRWPMAAPWTAGDCVKTGCRPAPPLD